jgi:hypothetical protein
MQFYFQKGASFVLIPSGEIFYGLRYARAKSCCKTKEFSAMPREFENVGNLASASLQGAEKSARESATAFADCCLLQLSVATAP